jgi:hypothetical protein
MQQQQQQRGYVEAGKAMPQAQAHPQQPRTVKVTAAKDKQGCSSSSVGT